MNDGTIGTWSYRAGGWFAVFGTNTTLLLPESERERVVDLWALVDGGADFTQVLDALLASGLSTLRGFVLVGADVGPTRILLRGDDVHASLTTASETVELEGAGTTTWVERAVDDVTMLVVTVGDDAGGPDFPIDGGLVRVSRIDLPPAGRPEVQPDAATVLPAEPDVVADEEPSPLSADDASIGTVPPPPPPPPYSPSPALADTGPQSVVPLEPPDGPLGPPPEGPPDTAPDTPENLQPWPEPAESMPAESMPAESMPAESMPSVGMPSEGEPDDDPVTEHMPAVPPPPPPSAPSIGDLPIPPPPSAPETGDSDHDGLTQAGVDADEFSREQPGIPGQPMAPSVTRPVAQLVISTGETVDVDRVVLIGRAPEARRFTSTEQPTLVTVPSPMHEISSTHVEVRPGSGADHGSAVVTDMGSTNGTVLVQPGLPPEDLKPGIAVQLIPGAIINLGDGLTIQVARP